MSIDSKKHVRLPKWFTVQLGHGNKYTNVLNALSSSGLHTVCSSARCPNLGECWSAGTATFLIMGDICTRNCRFCAVASGTPSAVDVSEPQKVAEAAKKMGLTYAVVTSVTRDDLRDGGARLFADTIKCLRNDIPNVEVEVLIPDFQGDPIPLKTVLNAEPDVLNHNVETVPRLYSSVRPQADYNQSISLLRQASEHLGTHRVKSGLMLGMGETRDELADVLDDLVRSGVSRLTLGQYLQPTRHHLKVHRYLHPREFDEIGQIAKSMGFKYVASGPLVRSSYHAHDMGGLEI